MKMKVDSSFIIYKNEFKYFIAPKVKAKTIKTLGENIG